MTTAKSTNPFQTSNWSYLEQIGESSFSSLPSYYENDVVEPTTPTFRSVSPKIYNQQKNEYFEEMKDELEFGDDCDLLYEATLMNSNFLNEDSESLAINNNNSSLARLRQLLNHISPGYSNKPVSTLTSVLSTTTTTPSVRSQFSASSSSTKPPPQLVAPMVAFSMPDLRESKGKGKFKPTL